MTTATVHYLPSARNGDEDQDQNHAADVAALIDELGTVAGQLADARALLDQMRSAFGARSDERDRWSAAGLAMFGDGYRAGCEAGEVIGAGRAIREWKVTAYGLPDLGGPAWIEVDRRRYPSYRPGVPDGRLSWVIPRDGERCAHEAVGLDCPTGYDGCPYSAGGGQR